VTDIKANKNKKLCWAVGEVELDRVRLQRAVWQWLLSIMGRNTTICWKGGGARFESLSGRPYSPDYILSKSPGPRLFKLRNHSLSRKCYSPFILKTVRQLIPRPPIGLPRLWCVWLVSVSSTPFLPFRNRENGRWQNPWISN
jgi:hypothetical protein